MPTDDVTGRRPELDEDTLAFVRQVFAMVRAGEADRLRPLLERGLPANLRNQNGDSLLMLACYHGHAETASLLLAHGGDTALRNDRGQSPLAGAAFKGDPEIVRLLLAHGADVDDAGPDGRTALMLAAMFNRLDVLDMLLAAGADPAARDARNLSALDAAMSMDAADTARRLAEILEAVPARQDPARASPTPGG